MTATTTQPDPQVDRRYPAGWDLGYCVSGDESDGTAYVPIALGRDAVAEDAGEAERVTGARMEVFHDGATWCYRPALPASRKPLTLADIPRGQGPASLFLHRDPAGVLHLMMRPATGDPVVVVWGEASPTVGEAALFAHLTATLLTVTTEEDA